MVISKKILRRYLLLKQLLLPPQSFQGYGGIEKVFKIIRCIQFDPLSPCGNNVDLVLQARVQGIHPQDYHHWLYKHRKGIECFDKEMCIVPIEDFSFCRSMFLTTSRKVSNFMNDHKKSLEKLILKIDKQGEISSAQINDLRKISNFWGNPKWGKAALDILWMRGKLVISKRDKNRKYFDLPKKIYREKYQWQIQTKLTPQNVLRRITNIGMLPKSGTGQGWLGVGTGKEISAIINQLFKEKVLTEIIIKNVKKTYVLTSSDIELLKKAKRIKILPSIVFLAPLDNLLWDREMIENVFDFKYKWEVYTPKNQRKYGYYVLPILFGDRFIGRIEPRKVGNILEVRGLWIEPNFNWDKRVNDSFNLYLENFKKYLLASSIKWLCSRPFNSKL